MPPTLSLAMIVKDEEHNLDQCLSSIAKYVNEIIIVDTGSTDRTREVATRWGASVYQFDHKNHPEAFFLDDEATCRRFAAPPPFSGEVALGDFAAARNESFRHAAGDYIVWADADDVVEGAEHLPKIVIDMAARGMDFGFLAYDYARDYMGRVFYRQWRERIIKKGTAAWINPVHEVILPARPILSARYDMTTNSHRRKADRKSIPNRNYKILLRQIKQHHDKNPNAPVDPRMLFYLGQESRFVEPLKAVGFYEAYLKTSGWGEERAAAHVAIGSLCEFGMLNLPADESYARANREFATAAAEMPDNPDGLFGLARIAYYRQRYQDCVSYTERAFKIGNTDSMLGANPMDRLYRPHFYLNDALYKLGRLDEAIESCKAALAVCPDDPAPPGGSSGMLSCNLHTIYEPEKARRAALAAAPPPAAASDRPTPLVEFDKNEDVDAPPAGNIPRDAFVIWAMQLWKRCVELGDAVRARGILDSLPPEVAIDPAVGRMRASTDRRFPKRESKDPVDLLRGPGDNRGWNEVADRIVHTAPNPVIPMPLQVGKSLSVVVWVGESFEPWDPTTPNTKGIGGSETACIEMCRELVALGHRVVVYGDCPNSFGNYDGVEYRHFSTFAGADCDVFISSRQPGIMGVSDKINAKLRLLWVHDIACGPDSADMQRWLLRFDRVLCLSEWHKGYFCQHYPTLHPDRVVVTRNGIDPERFRNPLPKKNSMVFSSSPNRGLDLLLQNFFVIQRRVPDAELHVYYGFDCWETLSRKYNDQPGLAEIARYKSLIQQAELRGGVFWHGRVSQPELARAWLEAKVWPYLTTFSETSCISAMEAQAAGCVPVCSRLAALAETVKHGVFIDNASPNNGSDFVEACVSLLTDDSHRAPLAQAGRAHAMANLSWKGLAAEWSQMFDRLAAEVDANPAPLWRSA